MQSLVHGTVSHMRRNLKLFIANKVVTGGTKPADSTLLDI